MFSNSIVVRALRREEVGAWLRHCVHVFSEDKPEYFESHLHDDPLALADPNNILVAVDEENHDKDRVSICGTVRLVPRRQFLGKRVVSVTGIAEVSVQEELRHQGIASRLLEQALDGPVLGNTDISVLSTDAATLGTFYGRHGWQSIDMQFAQVSIASSSPDRDLRMDSLVLAKHASIMLPLYHRVSAEFNGPFVRSVEYFERWIAAKHKRDGVEAIGAWSSSGDLLGYIFGCKTKEEDDLEGSRIDVEELIVPLEEPSRRYIAERLLLALVPTEKQVTARLPLPLVERLNLEYDPLTISIEKDFMYRRHNLSADLWQDTLTIDTNYLFWETDDF